MHSMQVKTIFHSGLVHKKRIYRFSTLFFGFGGHFGMKKVLLTHIFLFFLILEKLPLKCYCQLYTQLFISYRWKAFFITYNPAIHKFSLKCNPDLLGIFIFNKAEKKYFAYNSPGLHFSPPSPIQFFVRLDLPYHPYKSCLGHPV